MARGHGHRRRAFTIGLDAITNTESESPQFAEDESHAQHLRADIRVDGRRDASPGAPEEDTSGGFRYGGWTVGYFDEVVSQEMMKEMGHPFELLLGRRTYDIFASHWPKVVEPGADLGINKALKYVATNRALSTNWNGTASRLEGSVVEAIRKLKAGSGPELQVHGSGTLIQPLLENDLVDELWLKIFPVTIGSGRRLFAGGTRHAGFALVDSSASPGGVIIAKYRRAGEVKSGPFMQPA